MIWVLLQADGSQWSLVTEQVQHVPGFLPWMLFGRPPLLAQCVDLDVHLYYMAVQNLVYRCGNVPQVTTESSDTPQIHCVQHVQQPLSKSIQLPAGLKCIPIQMAKLRQQVQDAWDSLSQDDIEHLYDCMRELFMPALQPGGATLCFDVTVWALLTVTCVFDLD